MNGFYLVMVSPLWAMGSQESTAGTSTKATLSRSGLQNVNAIRLYTKTRGSGKAATSRALLHHFPEYSHPFVLSIFGLPHHGETEVTQEQIITVVDKVSSPRSTTSLSRIYLEAFCKSTPLEENEVQLLIDTAFRLFLATCDVSPSSGSADQEIIRLITQTLLTTQTIPASLTWLETCCPDLLMGMHHWFVAHVASEDQHRTEPATEYTLSDHEGALLTVSMWWLLGSSLPAVYTQPARTALSADGHEPQSQSSHPWTLLYSSKDHGLSVNRLQHHVLGYRGPTVLVVSCEGGCLYAVALDTEWREGTSAWGGGSCVAIRIAPDYSILQEGANMVMFNDKSRNVPRGLFVGQDPKRRLLSLTDGLQTVTHGGLTGHVVDAEVWGCGSADVKKAQVQQKKTELKDAERNAKVKLPGQWDDNPDRMLLGWGTARTDYADGYREDRK